MLSDILIRKDYLISSYYKPLKHRNGAEGYMTYQRNLTSLLML